MPVFPQYTSRLASKHSRWSDCICISPCNHVSLRPLPSRGEKRSHKALSEGNVRKSASLFAGVYFLYSRLWLCAGLQPNLIISMKGQQGGERERGIWMDKGGWPQPSPPGTPIAYLAPWQQCLCITLAVRRCTQCKLLCDSSISKFGFWLWRKLE